MNVKLATEATLYALAAQRAGHLHPPMRMEFTTRQGVHFVFGQ